MEPEILQRPANSVAQFELNQGDKITAEGGSMVAMTGNLDVETTTHKKGKGSILKALKRVIAGESLFLNHYECKEGAATLFLAPGLSGDMMTKTLSDKKLIVQGASFVAHWGDVEMDMSFQGMKNLFSGEGMFWIEFSGTGKVLLNSFGAIYPIEVEGEFIVDSGHIVAFEEGLEFSLSKVGTSWIKSFLGGEGVVCRFKGTGTVWCQSHNPSAFGLSLGPKLRATA